MRHIVLDSAESPLAEKRRIIRREDGSRDLEVGCLATKEDKQSDGKDASVSKASSSNT